MGLPNTKAQRELPIQLGVCKKQISAAVQPFHDRLIRGVPALVAEADQVQRYGRSKLKTGILAHPVREICASCTWRRM